MYTHREWGNLGQAYLYILCQISKIDRLEYCANLADPRYRHRTRSSLWNALQGFSSPRSFASFPKEEDRSR